jgi:hypothetical protein
MKYESTLKIYLCSEIGDNGAIERIMKGASIIALDNSQLKQSSI